jgi:hypothetical protein
MLVPKTFFLLCCLLLGVDLSFHSWQSPGVYPGILLFKEIGFSGIVFLGLKSLNLNDALPNTLKQPSKPQTFLKIFSTSY